MRLWRRSSLVLSLCIGAALIASSAIAAGNPGNGGGGGGNNGGPSKIDLVTPTISCFGNTGESITLQVCAGSTGTPAGFSIHIKTLADYNIDGWAQTGSYRCVSYGPGLGCGAPWLLAAGQCVTVTLDASTLTSGTCGVSGDCGDILLTCGTQYVFQVFAHGNSDYNKSPEGPNPYLLCSTADCPVGGCTLTWGYWKTHGPEGCSPGNQENAWPVSSLVVGGQTLTAAQICAIFQQNPAACGKGTGANAVIILEHQLLAAMLNVANGAISCASANAAIAAANTELVGRVGSCIGASEAEGPTMIGLAAQLGAYNSDICSCSSVVAPAPNSAIPVPSATTKSSWGQLKSIYR